MKTSTSSQLVATPSAPGFEPLPAGDSVWDSWVARLLRLFKVLIGGSMEVDPGLQLAVALLVMFFGALLAGALPWLVKVRDSQLKAVAALGGGLLIGTSLAIVIPEGFHALAEAGEETSLHVHSHAGHAHDLGAAGHSSAAKFAGLVLVGGFLSMLILDHVQHAAGEHHLPHQPASSSAGGSGGSGGGAHGNSCSHGHQHGHSHSHSHAPGPDPAPPPPPPPPSPPSLDGMGADSATELVFDSSDLERHPLTLPPPPSSQRQQQPAPARSKGSSGGPQRAITGLMIHCAADGLAMGAAALSGDLRLSMMISIAMVVHKAPMAFGLATYLMNHKWSWARAQSTMVLFSGMAPLGAIATYLLLGNISLFTSTSAVALIVLFSGGTFLYAATMHILPEVLGAGCHLSVQQIGAVTLGGLLPVLLSFGHEH